MSASPQPTEEQKAAEADQHTERPEENPKGWPHQPIQELDPEERDALLASGGPVGEMARVAWAQYETAQRRLEEPHSGSEATGPTSEVGTQELPPGPPSGVIPPAGEGAQPPPEGTPTKAAPKASTASKSG